MTGGRPTLTILIPAYNEQAGLAQSVEVLNGRLAALKVDAEILIVDDGSRDGTPEIADGLARDQAQVRVVHHPMNQGIGRAFQTGVANAHGDWLILIPADLALEPDEFHKYLDASHQADIVVGNRSDVSDYSVFRRLVHYTNIWLIRLLFQMPVHQFQYISLYRMEVLRAFDIEYVDGAFFLAEILIKARALGAQLVEVPIRYSPRRTGRATGARWPQVVRTVSDMLRFWWRWVRLGPASAARYRAYVRS